MEDPGVPLEVPLQDPWNYMTGQGAKQQCSLKSWYSIHVHTCMSILSTLAGPHSQDGRWAHP